MADRTRAQIIAKARRLLDVTDASKGGPADADLYDDVNDAIEFFVAEAGALKTVIKLATTANDQYLPLVSEILWPITVNFLDTDGNTYPLAFVEVAPRPGQLGTRPTVTWLTAVNVPDETGPSVPTLGIDPYVNWAPASGSYNVILEAIQLNQPLAADSDIPEIKNCLHGTLAYCVALEILPMFPEKLQLEAFLTRRRSAGIALFRQLAHIDAKAPKTRKDAMGYKNRSRARW